MRARHISPANTRVCSAYACYLYPVPAMLCVIDASPYLVIEKMLELEQKLSRIADEHLAELTKRETDNNHLTDKVTTNQSQYIAVVGVRYCEYNVSDASGTAHCYTEECETLRNECNLLRTRIQTVEADQQR